jgi:7-cyano-7-deazaguanine synthase
MSSTGRTRGIVLLSGGMDSCVTAAIARQTHDIALLHCSYGQRTSSRERKAFTDIADYYEAPRLLVAMDHLSAIGGSSLTDPAIPVPRADLSRKDIPTSYVPFRNANMLAAAVSWAEATGASAVFIGAVEEDSSGYPDCRRVFFDAFEHAVRAGTKPGTKIALVTPVIGMKKREIVTEGFTLRAPLHLTWSCYVREDVACGRCDSCALRLRAFRQAGRDDPIPYAEMPAYT